jgi:hypothetical protein
MLTRVAGFPDGGRVGDRPPAGGPLSTNAKSTDGRRTGPTPHAREEARRIAREEPLAGLSPEEAVAALARSAGLGRGYLSRVQVMEPQAA